jgi:hypothetical protein
MLEPPVGFVAVPGEILLESVARNRLLVQVSQGHSD